MKTSAFGLAPRVAFTLFLFGGLGATVRAQTPALPAPTWEYLGAVAQQRGGPERWVTPQQGGVFRVNHAQLTSTLSEVVAAEPAHIAAVGRVLEVPMPEGRTARFRIVETPVMAPELAAQFPDIKTYAGEGIDDPEATARFDVTPAGFHAQILSPHGAVYVDPAFRGDPGHVVSYHKRDHQQFAGEFECTVLREAVAGGGGAAQKTQSGPTLRTFRLACAATGEYTQFHGGTVALGQAAIVTAINRVNGIFEKELAVRLVLVGNNSLLVYTNPATDPYTNEDGNAMLGQNQSTVDAVIGSANYDIGHVFSTGGGGVATLGSVCNNSVKARGVTGNSSPTGDSFWVDYVAHELGHQFGANHTFNATSGNCGGGNRNASTAYEPGSGSTIMAYAGICSPNNLQSLGDAYFHTASLDEIQNFLAGVSCAANSATGNSAPVVSAGGPYTIPAATPFFLTASAVDPNGDALTYCWEQRDLGAAASLTGADSGSGPLFRSFPPTNHPTRFFPRVASVLANTNWNQEVLPTTTRTLNFRVTVRDNRAAGGGVADADTVVNVINTGAPFRVTSPNTAIVWSNTHTVTWNVAGTASAPINVANVNIFLSTDGGQTWPHWIATNAPNTGSHTINVRGLVSTQARIKVEAAGSIFYDVSDANFTIITIAPELTNGPVTVLAESCVPTNGVVDPYETVTVNWAIANTGNDATTNLVATLLATNGVYFPSGPQNYGVIPPGGVVARPFTFTAGGPCGGAVTGVVQLADGPAHFGTRSRVFNLGTSSVSVVTQVFNSASVVSIPSSGTATPYPSVINVAGVTNPVTRLTVSLNGLTHTYVEDVFALLAAPNGGRTMLMSYAYTGAVSGVTLTFDDQAANLVPYSGGIPSGTYLPTDYYFGEAGPYSLPAPAPGWPYGNQLAPLATSPNGTWGLYVFDLATPDVGTLAGWTLRFVTTATNKTCCATLPAPTFTSTTWSNGVAHLTWAAVPGPNYQVQFRTNLASGSWQNLGAPVPGTNALLSITNAVSGVPMRFYRILVQP